MTQARGSAQFARAGAWLFAGLLLFVLCFFLSAASSRWDEVLDEPWFLQLLDRVASGDDLYEDVWFSATPLAVYGSAVFTTLFGVEVLALKAYVVLIFALITLLSCRIDRQLGSSSRFHPLLVLALLVYAIPRGDAPTTLQAILFLLVSFSAALTWWDQRSWATTRERRRRLPAPLLVAGAGAGLSFASKQNIGLLTVSALLLVLFVASRDKGIRERSLALVAVTLPFVLVVGAVSLPVLLSGGWDGLVYYGFRDQGTYLRLGSYSYLTGLGTLGRLLLGIRSLEDLQFVYPYTAFLIPLATLGALSVARVVTGPDPRGRGFVVLAFVTAGCLGIFPRADLAHLAYVLPAVLLGLSYGLRRIESRLPERLSRALVSGSLFTLALILAFNLVSPIRRAASDLFRVSTVAHFQGVLVRSTDEERTLDEAQVLIGEVAGDRTFLLLPSASFHYLVSGLENPTPFDIPIAQVFGATGQQDVIDAIQDGRIDAVCLGTSEYLVGPIALERFVRQWMEPGRDVGPCTVYSRVTG